MDHLPVHSQVVLSHTCRSIRLIHRLNPDKSRLDREEVLALLSCLVRDMPNQWVCEGCVKLHDTERFDTPGVSQGRRCPQNNRLDVLRLGDIEFTHHNIQLALKYARMSKIDKTAQRYLDAVLASHQCPPPPHWDYLCQNGVVAKHSFFPKIVEGRFIIQSTIHFDPVNPALQRMSPENLPYWKVCPHQRSLCGHSLQSQNQILRRPLRTEYFLWATLLEGSEYEGSEACGSCPRCPTDFAFQIDTGPAGRATLRVWVDLGPEDSPMNAIWIHRVGKERSWDPDLQNNERGRVRGLYESWPGRTAPKRRAEIDSLAISSPETSPVPGLFFAFRVG
ncbi:hypothetical protein B0T10DRAFT_607973 [Thelonectria olida]|uniref:Uncharacterized protein n=1 Tax=Thelonectria olida TaxID=1576542 RepID=A0A9P8W2L2_9HYPO|nr:hypothetical protein B0T10DRAFT_607973 [Thelonectria olida]